MLALLSSLSTITMKPTSRRPPSYPVTAAPLLQGHADTSENETVTSTDSSTISSTLSFRTLVISSFILAVAMVYCDDEYYAKARSMIDDRLEQLALSRQRPVTYKPGSVAIVTLITNRFNSRYTPHWLMMKKYCKRHNYSCLRFTGDELSVFRYSPYEDSVTLAPHWRKLLVVYEALRRHEYVMFLDIDNWITMPQLKVKRLFPPDNSVDVIFSGNPCFSSSHFFVLHKSKQAMEFLRLWWRRRSLFRDNCHFDQGAFNYAMFEMTVRHLHGGAKLREINRQLAMCGGWVNGRNKGPIHYSKCNTFQTCLKDVCAKWVAPIFFANTTLQADLVKSSALPMEELQRRASTIPLTWAVAPWRRVGWNDSIVLSQQGSRKSTFADCSNWFSVHPIKRLSQLQCDHSQQIKNKVSRIFSTGFS